MTADDRLEPPPLDPPPSFGPRRMRASLSSSLGRPTAARDLDGAGRREPTIAPSAPEVTVSVAAPASPEPAPEVLPRDAPAVNAAASGGAPSGGHRPAAARPSAARAGGRAPKPKGPARPPPGKTIVPPQAVAGRALVSVVAIMCFLAALAVGVLTLVVAAAQDWQLDVSREATIQVKPIDGQAIEPRLAKALDIARATRGVRSARLVDERESAALLEPWLGRGLDLSSLPIPRLVVVDLADPATADLTGLRLRIAAEVAGAAVDDHAVWAARLRTMAGAMVVVGVGVVGLMLAAMVLSVVFATRAAMAGNREVIEVLHFVGAEDRFIARQFQRHFLLLGLRGGAIGGSAAAAAFLIADFATRSGRADGLADQAQALFGGFSVGLAGYAAVIGLVAVVAALTAITSRATVLGHLGRLD
ncbi:ABC transporter permease [Siculibacillus lacustris]|uniref:ABC transporter permease n=1 Tax=Siculibacillus lacustris TaxID=1549641 RepID=A0A4Q9VGD6_9HYPH|nr:ABC transporter permease [Siculibacillus lacustris]TBW33962.1 ABC transporter permease [Siculibacillus lacustris]